MHNEATQARLETFSSVLRIHDILVWIRIRIRGSMILTNGSGSGFGFGSGSFYFHPWSSRCQQKTNLKKVCLHITFWRYFYIIFQRQKVKKKSQTVKIKVFWLYDRRSGAGSGSIPMTNGSGSGPGSRRPKNTWIRWIRIRNTAFRTCNGWLQLRRQYNGSKLHRVPRPVVHTK
jgi:hypothetical protein